MFPWRAYRDYSSFAARCLGVWAALSVVFSLNRWLVLAVLICPGVQSRDILSVEQQDLQSLIQDAFQLYQTGKLQECIHLLLQANKLAPNRVEILELLGMTHLDVGLPQQAIVYWDSKLRILSPGDRQHVGATLYSLGVARMHLRQYQEAEQLFRVG